MTNSQINKIEDVERDIKNNELLASRKLIELLENNMETLKSRNKELVLTLTKAVSFIRSEQEHLEGQGWWDKGCEESLIQAEELLTKESES